MSVCIYVALTRAVPPMWAATYAGHIEGLFEETEVSMGKSPRGAWRAEKSYTLVLIRLLRRDEEEMQTRGLPYMQPQPLWLALALASTATSALASALASGGKP